MKLFFKYFLVLSVLVTPLPLTSMEKDEAAREKLLMLLSGEWVTRGVYAATELGIADHLLDGPKTVKELSLLTETDELSLKRLLKMLVGFGLFAEENEGLFINSDLSLLLAKKHPESLYSLSLFFGEEIHEAWDAIVPSLKLNTPAFEITHQKPVFTYFKENPLRAALFQDAMKQKSQAVIQSSIASYDFKKFHTIYDIGGGYGQFMIALLNDNPNLKGMIFELPEVIEILKIRSPLLESPRCELVAGNFFESIPEGGDAYLLKSVLHDWEEEKSEKILAKCYEAMTEKSRLLIIETILLPKDRSRYANCMDMQMMMITGGKERTGEAFKEMLEKAGFQIVDIYPTATEFSIIEAKKKR
ncbi:methyltransferase [Criblamydia sequanensis]|uniref:O-methyltransferase n=1 Tax=Candidatus Criblamydia sequanensis CRIB-18 TaxID=1437425 RepID=A0A090DW85_9BACT|nr:methyltransferase [Criblamydia sequanensis]CDR33164.1 O-methyltransferase [Criblamydia sequanensis CRIB-18]